MNLADQKYSGFMTQNIADFIRVFLCSQNPWESSASSQSAQTPLSLVFCMLRQAILSCPGVEHISYQG